jgi:hypothetical protein
MGIIIQLENAKNSFVCYNSKNKMNIKLKVKNWQL